jgi:hypothetical protein
MSELKVDKITPRLGTTLTLGDAGDTINFGSGVLPNFENLTVTGDLTVDTNSLKVDSTNNFVGIGTASPSVALDVVGAITATGNITGTLATASQPNITSVGTLTSATVSGDLTVGDGHQLGNETTYDNLVVKSSTDENMVLSMGGTGQLIVKTGSTTLDNGSERFRINNSGNVGIKNSSPSHTLDISDTSTTAKTLRVGQSSGVSTADATMIISNGGTGSAMLRFDYEGTNTDRARIGITSSGQNLQFFTAGNNERMRIASNGRVGIGTTNPTHELMVAGGTDTRVTIDGSSSAGLYITDSGASGVTIRNTNNGDLEFLTVTGKEVVFNQLSVDSDFRVESNNFADMLFVNGGTDRVGIGTNSPTTTLDVSKDSTSNIRVGGAGGGSVDTRLYVDNVGNGGSGRGVGIALRPSGSSNSVEAVKLIGYQETAASTANNAKFAIQVANSSGTLTERVSINNTGVFNITGSLTVNGSAVGGETASVWVNFNGTGTVAIRDDYNVSSITDNGTGDYTVNFTSSLANTNYSFTTASGKNAAGQFPVTVEISVSTSNIRVQNSNLGAALVDNDRVCIHIFGG